MSRDEIFSHLKQLFLISRIDSWKFSYFLLNLFQDELQTVKNFSLSVVSSKSFIGSVELRRYVLSHDRKIHFSMCCKRLSQMLCLFVNLGSLPGFLDIHGILVRQVFPCISSLPIIQGFLVFFCRHKLPVEHHLPSLRTRRRFVNGQHCSDQNCRAGLESSICCGGTCLMWYHRQV